MFTNIINVLKKSPNKSIIKYDLFDVCQNVIDNIDLQTTKQDKSDFKKVMSELHFEDEIMRMKEFYSSEELSLLLSDMR